jgi:hypothetical protein
LLSKTWADKIMAVYDLQNLADIRNAVREELKISATETETLRRITRDIQMVYREVISYARWWWLQESKTVVLPSAWKEGTCRVISGSATVEFSTPPGGLRKGQYFSVDATQQVYIIESHTPGTTTVKLSDKYLGPTQLAATYKIWTDRIALPTNCKETVEVRDMLSATPLENMGLQEFRRLMNPMPKREGNPRYYYTSDFVDPFPSTVISGLPAVTERKSDGVVKRLIFASAVPSSVTVGKALLIEDAGEPSYNGEVYVASITTTRVANDTIVYTGKSDTREGINPETAAQVKALDTNHSRARYRELHFYPAVSRTKTLLHIDFSKETPPLENDGDEPVIPVDDRVVLLYGALQKAWTRERNPEEAAKNYALYQQKLQRMAGQLQDSLDKAIMRPSRLYMSAKRSSMRRRRFSVPITGASGGSGATMANEIYGLPDSVAIFNGDGVLEGSSSVSVTELGYLDGATSNIQGQISAITASLAGANIVNAQISPSAAIARSKLASGGANAVIINDNSGVMSESSILASELSFLAGAQGLASVNMVNNTASPLPLITIPKTNSYVWMFYSIKRGSTNVEGGYILLLNDGTNANIAIMSSNVGSSGADFTADVSGSDVRLLYTLSNTGIDATFKYEVIKWAA